MIMAQTPKGFLVNSFNTLTWIQMCTQLCFCVYGSYASTLDKQRICVNTQILKKAIKMKCVRTEKQF